MATRLHIRVASSLVFILFLLLTVNAFGASLKMGFKSPHGKWFSDLPPRTSPLLKLDPEPFEVHPRG